MERRVERHVAESWETNTTGYRLATSRVVGCTTAQQTYVGGMEPASDRDNSFDVSVRSVICMSVAGRGLSVFPR